MHIIHTYISSKVYNRARMRVRARLYYFLVQCKKKKDMKWHDFEGIAG